MDKNGFWSAAVCTRQGSALTYPASCWAATDTFLTFPLWLCPPLLFISQHRKKKKKKGSNEVVNRRRSVFETDPIQSLYRYRDSVISKIARPETVSQKNKLHTDNIQATVFGPKQSDSFDILQLHGG